MSKALMFSIALILTLLTSALFVSIAQAPDLVFQMQPLIQGPVSDESPSILQDSSGKIWVFFLSRRIEAGHRHVFYITSVDSGITWTEPSVFLPAYLPGVDSIYGVAAFQDSTGRFWVARAREKR
jgi:hypothetical protein